MSSDSQTGLFDPDLIEQVAGDHGFSPEQLTALVDAHQEQMATLPGVENLVYEWRKQFDATVLHRTDAAYYVAAPDWAWDEFGESLAADDAEMGALRDLHRRIVVESGAVAVPTADATDPMVLLRT